MDALDALPRGTEELGSIIVNGYANTNRCKSINVARCKCVYHYIILHHTLWSWLTNDNEQTTQIGCYTISRDIPVSKRGDTETLSTSKELILIHKVYISDRYNTLILIFQEIESRLFQPLKVLR